MKLFLSYFQICYPDWRRSSISWEWISYRLNEPRKEEVEEFIQTAISNWAFSFLDFRNPRIIFLFLWPAVTFAQVNTDGTFSFAADFSSECALLLDGPGRTSPFDFNTNTIRGGPQWVNLSLIFTFFFPLDCHFEREENGYLESRSSTIGCSYWALIERFTAVLFRNRVIFIYVTYLSPM